MSVTDPAVALTCRVLILMHDDYAAGGLQRSALMLRQALTACGQNVSLYCMRAIPGGYSEKFDFVRPVMRDAGSWPGWWITFFSAWRRVVRAEKPDVVIGLGVAPSVISAVTRLGLRQVQAVGSERVYPPAEAPTWPWRLFRRIAYPLLHRVVCQTEPTRDWFATNFAIPSDRLAIIPNIVEAPQRGEGGTERFESPGGGPIVAAIGRMEFQKGFDYALAIFGEISLRDPDARFLIAGDGPLYDSLASDAQKTDFSARLLFRSRIEDLAAVWPHIDVFLLPSRYEGFPNVLAEAMANGVACVAFDCLTGPAELIETGYNGFLVPVGDCSSAAGRCLELLKNSALRKNMGRNAREVRERFSAARIGAKWNNLVVELVASTKRGSTDKGPEYVWNRRSSEPSNGR